jgi:uncharacterized protein (TIGR03382 family)
VASPAEDLEVHEQLESASLANAVAAVGPAALLAVVVAWLLRRVRRRRP